MKIITMISLVLLQFYAFGQDAEQTENELKLFIPAHLKNDLPADCKLKIYFTLFSR